MFFVLEGRRTKPIPGLVFNQNGCLLTLEVDQDTRHVWRFQTPMDGGLGLALVLDSAGHCILPWNSAYAPSFSPGWGRRPFPFVEFIFGKIVLVLAT